MNFDSKLAQCQALVNAALECGGPRTSQEFLAEAVPNGVAAASNQPSRTTDDPRAAPAPSDRLTRATQYALSGGKRLRPYIVFSVAEMLARESRGFLDVACAVECVHTSSLIFDDLPCMDDSSTRRGKPSLHCKFDEATAILTAVSLLSRGFAHLVQNTAALGLPAEVTNRALTCLAQTVGARGMAAGQMTELLENATTDLKTVEVVNDRKTSSLFVASAHIPAILAGASGEDTRAVASYAHDLGLAYQITDDILDYPTREHNATGAETPEEPSAHQHGGSNPLNPHAAGRDSRWTIPALLGMDKARKKAGEHIVAAIAFLEGYGESAKPLRLLASYVLSRVE